MTGGFHGRSAGHFMDAVNRGMGAAAEAHGRDPFEGMSGGLVALPRIMPTLNQGTPFDGHHQVNVSHRTGVGTSSNIVVSGEAYHEAAHRLVDLDYEVGGELYAACEAIERMCRETFVVPETTAAITGMTDRLKAVLNTFWEMTGETAITAKKYVGHMLHVDAR